METAKRTDFSSAKRTVNGYGNSFAKVAGMVFVLISAILFITFFENRNNVPESTLITGYAVSGALMLLSVAAVVAGVCLKARRNKQVSFAAFDGYVVVFVPHGKIKGYLLVGYEEITEYGFIHRVSDQSSHGEPYFKSDLLNHGFLLLTCENGNMLKVPVSDIETVRECLAAEVKTSETLYQKIV